MTILTPSVAQKVNRETVVILGWGRAILMQLAHPLVAAGIADHSHFGDGALGYAKRSRRTIAAMLALTFGSEDEARGVAARIRAIHDTVNGRLQQTTGVFQAGTAYSAHDPELLRWVHATLLDSMLMAYERFVGSLTSAEKDRYCAEAAMMAPLLGMAQDSAPCNFRELERYMATMIESGRLNVDDRARRIARQLLSPSLGPLISPLFIPARFVTVGLLPPAIRDSYRFPWPARHEWTLNRLIGLVKTVRLLLPRAIREWPSARRAGPHTGNVISEKLRQRETKTQNTHKIGFGGAN